MSVLTVLEKLGSLVEREVNLIVNSKQEAETLKSKLESIQEGMQDAERRGVTDLNVKSWLKRLEDVMYEMDDALDKWEIKNLELQIEQSEYDDITDHWEKVRSVLLSLCLCHKHYFGRRGLTLEMKTLSAKLDKILEEKGKYDFVPNNNSREPERPKNPETTSSVDESKVYGRNSDKDSLVDFLLSKDEQQGTQVSSIVGEGGLGKTTLAQLVFNDPRLEGHFDLKAWVSVPDPFNASQVAKAILEGFGESSSSIFTLENLGRRIKAIVSNQNFLLVLDNVWTVDRTQWKSLKNFLVGAPRCRILVTTRDETAAETLGTTHSPCLNLLSDSDCATILNEIALGGRSEEEKEIFHESCLEIAKKCNGLPLAAETIGHMLKSRFSVEEWRDVLVSPLWKYEDAVIDIFGPLRLSYMDLSPILKRCFLSCVLYSKGSQFHVRALIRIWMAQGYIRLSKSWDKVNRKGLEYFQKLFMRSFFREVRRDKDVEGGITYKMHDVMHEFASHLSRSEYYFILDRGTYNTPINPRTRNFSATSVSLQCLPPNFLRLLKHVRVLRLRDCGLKNLSEDVGELIHLRYLDLSWNPITELPEKVNDLYNLQTLVLQSCDNLSSLPHGIHKLVNLRHLLIYDTNGFIEYTEGLEKLTSLWTLDEFRARGDSVGYLGNLNELRGSLKIYVKGLTEAAEAEKANLRDKNHIEDLQLFFSEDVSKEVVEAMVPPPQLQTLWIRGRRNVHQLPNWITTTIISSFNNLKELILSGFDVDSSYNLPPLGQLPMLEALEIRKMNFKRVTLQFLGVVPKGTSTAVAVGRYSKLKKLRFYNCELWQEWEDMDEAAAAAASVPITMPCLRELEIEFCDKLPALPHRLLLHDVATSLDKLTIANSKCLEFRYHKRRGADRDKISHIPNIYISGITSKKMDHA